MGRRQRRREGGATPAGPVSATDYADPDGNVLSLRNSVSSGTAAKLRASGGRAAASADDQWQRREELRFERLAVSWTIAGLPLERQEELLGRYRMASAEERRWVRETLDAHVRERMPELAE